MFTLRLLRYQYGDSFYHRHHSVLKLAELLLVCILTSLASWCWNALFALTLLLLLRRMLPWNWWGRVLYGQLCLFLLFAGLAFWSSWRRLELIPALVEASQVALPLNCMSLQSILFIRHTEPLGLIAQLNHLTRWRWLRSSLMLSALVMMFFPLIFEQLQRRRVFFTLRGGRWWQWWSSLPQLLGPVLFDIERRSLRTCEALLLRGDWRELSFASPEVWRFSDVLSFLMLLCAAVLGLYLLS